MIQDAIQELEVNEQLHFECNSKSTQTYANVANTETQTDLNMAVPDLKEY